MGMNIIGICAKLFPDVRILTFEIMSNHVHIAAAARRERILAMFDAIRLFLQRFLKGEGRPCSLSDFHADLRALETLDDVRNVIVYDNRNGFLVDPQHTPFTYPWGANRYYFSPDTCRLAKLESKTISLRARRQISHSRMADAVSGLLSFDGCALPLSFCDVTIGESLFRDASHYFGKVSRAVESNARIAKEIGESVWYTDDDLYSVCLKRCRESYGVALPKQLDSKAKIELAKVLRYDYNAGLKQIQRMLKIEASVLASLGILK